jgi:hypothetical protein
VNNFCISPFVELHLSFQSLFSLCARLRVALNKRSLCFPGEFCKKKGRICLSMREYSFSPFVIQIGSHLRAVFLIALCAAPHLLLISPARSQAARALIIMTLLSLSRSNSTCLRRAKHVCAASFSSAAAYTLTRASPVCVCVFYGRCSLARNLRNNKTSSLCSVVLDAGRKSCNPRHSRNQLVYGD